MTIPSWRWSGSWVTERGSGRVCSANCSHITCLPIRFGRPGKGNDKGKVEGLVGLIRRNYLVPLPHAASFAALNEQLLADCRRRLGDRLRGHAETIGERLAGDLACFHDLPVSPYDAWEVHVTALPDRRRQRFADRLFKPRMVSGDHELH